jgi:hypothetical protein
MEIYIAQALRFRPADTSRTTGSPKRRKDTPSPKVRHVTTWRRTKKGTCAAAGSGKSGGSEVGHRIGPATIAATAAMRVTATTLIQVLFLASPVPPAT